MKAELPGVDGGEVVLADEGQDQHTAGHHDAEDHEDGLAMVEVPLEDA